MRVQWQHADLSAEAAAAAGSSGGGGGSAGGGGPRKPRRSSPLHLCVSAQRSSTRIYWPEPPGRSSGGPPPAHRFGQPLRPCIGLGLALVVAGLDLLRADEAHAQQAEKEGRSPLQPHSPNARRWEGPRAREATVYSVLGCEQGTGGPAAALGRAWRPQSSLFEHAGARYGARRCCRAPGTPRARPSLQRAQRRRPPPLPPCRSRDSLHVQSRPSNRPASDAAEGPAQFRAAGFLSCAGRHHRRRRWHQHQCANAVRSAPAPPPCTALRSWQDGAPLWHPAPHSTNDSFTLHLTPPCTSGRHGRGGERHMGAVQYGGLCVQL